QDDLRGLDEALGVLAQAEHGGAALGAVGADALEDARAVVERVGEDRDGGFRLGHQVAVEPDQAGALRAGSRWRGSLRDGHLSSCCTPVRRLSPLAGRPEGPGVAEEDSGGGRTRLRAARGRGARPGAWRDPCPGAGIAYTSAHEGP